MVLWPVSGNHAKESHVCQGHATHEPSLFPMLLKGCRIYVHEYFAFQALPKDLPPTPLPKKAGRTANETRPGHLNGKAAPKSLKELGAVEVIESLSLFLISIVSFWSEKNLQKFPSSDGKVSSSQVIIYSI